MTGLLPYLPRLVRWPALATGMALAWTLTWWRAGDVTNEVAAMWLVRFVLIIAISAAVFAVDDLSVEVTRADVGARRALMPMRLIVVAGAVAAGIAPVIVRVRGELAAATAGGLVAEAAGLTLVMVGAALALQRRWSLAEPAQYLGALILLVGMFEQVTVGRWTLLAGPGPVWEAAHWRWAAIAAAGLVLCVIQLRDPASPRLRQVLSASGPGVASRREHISP